MSTVRGYAAKSATSPLAPFSFQRREPGPHDIVIDIQYCGVCHSDLHQVRNDWRGSTFPIVPGHEIVGRVTAAGPQVRKLKEGDTAGWAAWCIPAGTCASCKEGLEQYCEKRAHVDVQQRGHAFRRDDPMEGTPSESLWMRPSWSACPQSWTLPPPRRFCAPVSPRTSPLRRWKVGKGQKSAWWARRTGPHGSEAGACPRRRRGRVHDAGGKKSGCSPPWRARGGDLQERGAR